MRWTPFAFYKGNEWKVKMAKLTLNKNYLTINELLLRWGHTIDDFHYLIEQKEIDIYIRPLALRAALPSDYSEPLSQCPLAPQKVCRLIHEGQECINAQDFQNPAISPKHNIAFEITLGDVVVLMADVRDLEKEYGVNMTDKIEILSNDYSAIRVGDKEFIFGEKQARIVKYLYEQMIAGNPWVNGKTLIKMANDDGIRNHS
jgi:hypothetical protein